VFGLSVDEQFDSIVMMFQHLGILKSFGVAESTLRTFVTASHESYLDNPYHNFTHAFDVTQAMFVLLTTMNVQRCLRSIDVFAIMVASLCHDCGHPGVTNSYLIATNSPLTRRCKDQSILEHHHCSTAFELILEMEPNLLTNLSVLDRVEFKNAVETCILATDMAKHNVSGLLSSLFCANCIALDIGGTNCIIC
jgi:hypothetical protein